MTEYSRFRGDGEGCGWVRAEGTLLMWGKGFYYSGLDNYNFSDLKPLLTEKIRVGIIGFIHNIMGNY